MYERHDYHRDSQCHVSKGTFFRCEAGSPWLTPCPVLLPQLCVCTQTHIWTLWSLLVSLSYEDICEKVKEKICLEKGCSKLVAGNGSSSQFCVCSHNRMWELWIHGTQERNTYLLDAANVLSELSTSIHMGGQQCFHARLLIVHGSIRVAAGNGCSARAWKSYICPKQEGYISDWYDILPAHRFWFKKLSFLTIGKPMTSDNKTKTEQRVTLALERNLLIQPFWVSESFSAF